MSVFSAQNAELPRLKHTLVEQRTLIERIVLNSRCTRSPTATGKPRYTWPWGRSAAAWLPAA